MTCFSQGPFSRQEQKIQIRNNIQLKWWTTITSFEVSFRCAVVKTPKYWGKSRVSQLLSAGRSHWSQFISLTLQRPLRLKCDYCLVPAGSSASDYRVRPCDLTAPGPLALPLASHHRNINSVTEEGVALFCRWSQHKQPNTGDFIHGYQQGDGWLHGKRSELWESV